MTKKAIKDNFKGGEWTPERIYSVYIDGKNLFDFLRRGRGVQIFGAQWA